MEVWSVRIRLVSKQSGFDLAKRKITFQNPFYIIKIYTYMSTFETKLCLTWSLPLIGA